MDINMKSQGLPMSTIVIIILVVIVLVAVGLIFFQNVTSGQAGFDAGTASVDAGSSALVGAEKPFGSSSGSCSGTTSKICWNFCVGSGCAVTEVSSCSAIGCWKKCDDHTWQHDYCGDGDDFCIASDDVNEIYAGPINCDAISSQSNCNLAGCTWSSA